MRLHDDSINHSPCEQPVCPSQHLHLCTLNIYFQKVNSLRAQPGHESIERNDSHSNPGPVSGMQNRSVECSACGPGREQESSVFALGTKGHSNGNDVLESVDSNVMLKQFKGSWVGFNRYHSA